MSHPKYSFKLGPLGALQREPPKPGKRRAGFYPVGSIQWVPFSGFHSVGTIQCLQFSRSHPELKSAHANVHCNSMIVYALRKKWRNESALSRSLPTTITFALSIVINKLRLCEWRTTNVAYSSVCTLTEKTEILNELLSLEDVAYGVSGEHKKMPNMKRFLADFEASKCKSALCRAL